MPLQTQLCSPKRLSAGRSRPVWVAAVEAALATEKNFLAVSPCGYCRRRRRQAADLFEVGTLVMVKTLERFEDSMHIIAQGTERIRVLDGTGKSHFCAPSEILPKRHPRRGRSRSYQRNVQSMINRHWPSCRVCLRKSGRS